MSPVERDAGIAWIPATAPAQGAVLAILVLVAWADVLGLGFVGPDAWPLLLDARQALARPAALFDTAYLDASWSGARFLRPGFVGLHALLLAITESPFAFHVAGLVLLWCAAFAVARAVTHAVPAARFAGLAAGAFVALHPLHVDTLPALARRADLPAAALITVAVASLAPFGATRSVRRLLLGIACTALAPLFKETGLLAAPLALVALAFHGREDRGVRRDRRLAGAAIGIGFAVHLAWRLGVLGTIGTYDVAGRESAYLTRLGALVEGLVAHEGGLALGLAAGAALFLGLAGVVTVTGTGREKGSGRIPVGALATSAAWLVVSAIVLAASERCRVRHAVAILPPFALLLGLLAAHAERRPASTPRLLALAGFAAAALLTLAPGSPLVRGTGAWRVADVTGAAVIEGARSAVRDSERSGSPATQRRGAFTIDVVPQAASTRVLVAPFPYRAAPPGPPRVDGPMVLMPYSLEAALRFEFPALVPRVEPNGAEWNVTSRMLDDGTPSPSPR